MALWRISTNIQHSGSMVVISSLIPSNHVFLITLDCFSLFIYLFVYLVTEKIVNLTSSVEIL